MLDWGCWSVSVFGGGGGGVLLPDCRSLLSSVHICHGPLLEAQICVNLEQTQQLYGKKCKSSSSGASCLWLVGAGLPSEESGPRRASILQGSEKIPQKILAIDREATDSFARHLFDHVWRTVTSSSCARHQFETIPSLWLRFRL